MSSYITIAEANTYFASVLNTEPWDDATDERRTKALAQATSILNRLNYVGSKTDATQANEFPRFDETTVPGQIQEATADIAMKLLDDIDPDMEYDSLRVASSGAGDIKGTYAQNIIPEHIVAGVPSRTAWQMISPFLRSAVSLKIRRV